MPALIPIERLQEEEDRKEEEFGIDRRINARAAKKRKRRKQRFYDDELSRLCDRINCFFESRRQSKSAAIELRRKKERCNRLSSYKYIDLAVPKLSTIAGLLQT
jgi:hypothetical protein